MVLLSVDYEVLNHVHVLFGRSVVFQVVEYGLMAAVLLQENVEALADEFAHFLRRSDSLLMMMLMTMMVVIMMVL